jgi:predicted ATPase/class 3 adenylate cyclase
VRPSQARNPQSVRELPSGTVTFLFTDVEGSTRLLHEHGERYAEMLEEHRRVLREAFVRHGGVEVDTQGDSFFYAFRRAGNAVAAAEEGRRALEDGPILVRMGIHTGEPTVTNAGYVGIDVHQAARICSAAHGGQIVLSERTRSLLDGTLELTDLGLHRLKDLGQAVKLFQLGKTTFPPLRSLNASNLPAQPSPLVGRERELSELTGLVPHSRLVTLSGPGGSGKTRLALQVAAELVHEFVDGVFWVPLAAVTDPELVEPTIAQTLGAKEGLAAHIDERRMLLLLDNLEQISGAATTLSDLLGRCPHLHLLCTSRALLRLGGEREYPVEPLLESDAVTLFRERAVVSEPEEPVRDICRRLDGLPLAIELAAARTRVLPPEKLLARLEKRLPLLVGGVRDAPARQRTLRATIEWSYDLLAPEERGLLVRLAVFAGSFDVEAAEAVCGAELATLESLVEQSLVRRWASGRLGMLETIREFAGEQLDASGEAEALRQRHAEYVLALAESANLRDEAQGEMDHELMAPERDNLRAALEWCLDSGGTELGLRLIVALDHFWVASDPFEGARWCAALLERGADVPPQLRAHALRTYGGLVFIVGEFERGERLYEESLAESRALGDETGAAQVLARLPMAALVRGDLEAARALAEESLEAHRRLGNRKGEAVAIGTLGAIANEAGNPDLAVQLLQQSAELAGEAGFIWWQVGQLHQLGECALALGRLEDAERSIREGLELAHRIGNRMHVVYDLALLARFAAERGESERAGVLWGAVEADEQRGPVGQWEDERDAYAAPVLAHAGQEFDTGRGQGLRLSLDEAVEYALRTHSDT